MAKPRATPKTAEAEKLEAEIAKLKADTTYAQAQAEHENLVNQMIRLDVEDRQRRFSRERAARSENRILDFTGPVGSSSAESAIQALYKMAREDTTPITFRISSPGGSVIDGLALYDAIRATRAGGIPVHTLALGMAASMAAIILQAGESRVAAPNAYILVHEVSSGAIGKLSEMEDETKFVKRLNDRLIDILAERAKVSQRFIRTHARRKDWWLDAAQCVKIGLADREGYA